MKISKAKKQMNDAVKLEINYLKVMLPRMDVAKWRFIESALRMAYLEGRGNGMETILNIYEKKKK